jgi:hypothetical protein
LNFAKIGKKKRYQTENMSGDDKKIKRSFFHFLKKKEKKRVKNAQYGEFK